MTTPPNPLDGTPAPSPASDTGGNAPQADPMVGGWTLPEAPGWAPPQAGGQPGWAQPPPPPPPLKPGIVPLHPLSLGQIWDGAFKAIRYSPSVMVGLSAIVAALSQIPVFFATQAAMENLGEDASYLLGNAPASSAYGGSMALVAVTVILQMLASLILGGLLAFAVSRATLGRRVTIGETWRAVVPRIPALLGATLLVGLMGCVFVAIGVAPGLMSGPGSTGLMLLTLPLCLVGLAIVVVRLAFASVIVVLERVGPTTALRRSWQLTKYSFWRVLGILLLTGMVVGVAAQVATVPFSALFLLVPASTHHAVVIAQLVTTIAVYALTTPFSSSVTCLLYVDRRMRSEGLDVELARAVIP